MLEYISQTQKVLDHSTQSDTVTRHTLTRNTLEVITNVCELAKAFVQSDTESQMYISFFLQVAWVVPGIKPTIPELQVLCSTYRGPFMNVVNVFTYAWEKIKEMKYIKPQETYFYTNNTLQYSIWHQHFNSIS